MLTLITGANGFIGGALADRLVADGGAVRGLVREPDAAAGLAARGIEPAVGDVTDPASLKEAMRGVTRVFHTAGLVGDWLDREQAQQVNVAGTQHMIDAAETEGVERFVQLSSLSVLGTRHHYGTDESGPYLYGDPYTDTKIDSERVVRGHVSRCGMETVCVRPGFVYGPGDRQVIPGVVDALRRGRFVFVGSGGKQMNTIFVDDLVDACLLAMETPAAAGQVYNLNDGALTTVREFVGVIAHELELAPPTRRIPAAVAVPLTAVAERVARLMRASNPPLLNRSRLRFLYYNQHYSIEKARTELGFAPQVRYEEGLTRTLRAVGPPARFPSRH